MYNTKKYEDAIVLYTDGLKLNPNDIQSLYRRGRSYEELKLYDMAVNDFKKILDIDKKNVNALLSLSINSLRNKNYLDAESYSKKAIKINPDLDQAHLLLGRSLQYQGLFPDAMKSFKTSVSLNSDNSDSYYYMGLIYLKLDDSRNACKNFTTSASLENSKAINLTKKYCQ
jgi:tetratricopeptide (TPR) repeat protein